MTSSDVKPKILVVDDDRDIAEWLNQLLKLQGYLVSKAHDGIEALEHVAKEIPDLILMDLMMPKMDGQTAIRRLCTTDATCSIPVIVLSANPPRGKAAKEEMFGDGAKQVQLILQKPAPMMDLIIEVKRCLAV